jgi:diguanylate cyclase (GGDEF)-like protein
VWLAGVSCLLALVLPVGSPASVMVFRLSSLVAVLVFLWAVIRMPPGARGVWWGLWAFQVLTVAGDVVYDIYVYHLQQDPFPSMADVLYLASYLAVIAALALLVHRRQSGRGRETWIDTAVMTVAAACVVATVVVMPMLTDSSESGATILIALAYPMLDIVVLSVLIRLLVGVEKLNPALVLLTVAIACTLTADLVFNSLAAQGVVDETPAWVDVLFLAAVLLLSAAVTARGASTITQPAAATHRTKARLVGLAVAALTAPTLLAFAVWSEVGSTARLLAVASIAVILLILWGALILMSMVEQQSALLADLARRDGLTGLPNRRTWDFELGRVAAQTSAQGAPLTVAILDLDHFKEYNDHHGHPAGDAMLIDCARAWHSHLNPPAMLARYGGEEFAVLLPGADLDDARVVLELLRTATPSDQTVSIGYALQEPEESISDTVDRADQALYRAKSKGRDCIVAYESALIPVSG